MDDPRLPVPRPFRIDAVLFDFDGTLTEPGAIDFAGARAAMGCPPDSYTLEYIESLPAGGPREAAWATLERFEQEGAARSVAAAGAEDLVLGLKAQELPVGLLTRNGRHAVERSLANFGRLTAGDFDVVITRDDPVAPKPAPDAVLHFATQVGVAPEAVLMVGDFVLDVEAGRAAGAVTAFLSVQDVSGLGDAELFEAPKPGECDFIVDRLSGVEEVVRLGRPLPAGKLPNNLLARYLEGVPVHDRAVLVGAGVGEDVAALDVSADEVVVAHGDPITLTGRGVGRYAVTVNANDIAASGAEPRWFLTTVLLPAGTTAAEALSLLDEIARAAGDAGVAVVGGHTEITAAVAGPLVCGTMLGVLRRADLRDKRRAAAGDRVLLTKGLAIEGTALLAVELRETLRARGMDDGELDACAALLERAGVSSEARVAAGCEGVTAMHDVTEGGLATALEELGIACGRRVAVDLDRIPVLAQTRRVCGLLDADPLGLIASGSLLICCRPDDATALLDALTGSGIEVTDIGALGETGAGVEATAGGRAASWPRFARDEAARLLSPGGAERIQSIPTPTEPADRPPVVGHQGDAAGR